MIEHRTSKQFVWLGAYRGGDEALGSLDRPAAALEPEPRQLSLQGVGAVGLQELGRGLPGFDDAACATTTLSSGFFHEGRNACSADWALPLAAAVFGSAAALARLAASPAKPEGAESSAARLRLAGATVAAVVGAAAVVGCRQTRQRLSRWTRR